MSNAPWLSRHVSSANAITRATSGSTRTARIPASRLILATSLVGVQLLISESTRANTAWATRAVGAERAESLVARVT
jgi:hypothetical protein